MYHRSPSTTSIHLSDLNTLEARGAAFVTEPRPRHSNRRSSVPTSRASQPHSHSQLSGLEIFGISAYGIILIATGLALAIALIVLLYTVVYLFSNDT
jgi:hypothetical protein